MPRRKKSSPKSKKPAAAVAAPPETDPAEKALADKLRNELVDRLMRLRCREVERCSHGFCRRTGRCHRQQTALDKVSAVSGQA